MVDCYFPSGKKYRQVFYVKKRLVGGVWIRAWVEDDSKRLLKSIDGSRDQPLNNHALHQLKAHVDAHLESHRTRGHLVDVVATWRLWTRGQRFVARDFSRYPLNYEWDERTRQWENQEIQARANSVTSTPNTSWWLVASSSAPSTKYRPSTSNTSWWQSLRAVVHQAHTHPDESERVALVRSLTQFPAINAAKELRRFFDDPSEAVRKAALETYKSLPRF